MGVYGQGEKNISPKTQKTNNNNAIWNNSINTPMYLYQFSNYMKLVRHPTLSIVSSLIRLVCRWEIRLKFVRPKCDLCRDVPVHGDLQQRYCYGIVQSTPH